MRYKVSKEDEVRLEQFARSNFAQLIRGILVARTEELDRKFRAISPELFLQHQGRALEIDDLLDTLKIKALGE
jgi:hypothetical protein